MNEGVLKFGGTLGPNQEYGPSPGVAQMVAPIAPQLGKVILSVPAGNSLSLPTIVIGEHLASKYE